MFKVTFHGRKRGSSGIFYDIETEVSIDPSIDLEGARQELYETYDHIINLKYVGNDS